MSVTGGGTLTALNASTGAFLWIYRTPADYEIEYSPAVANGVIYFTSAYFTEHQSEFPVTLYAMNAATRQVIWQYDWEDAIDKMPVVGAGKVYYNSTAFDANTGAIKWQFANSFFSIPALATGVLYVGSFDGNFYALNANTGVVKWQYRPGGDVPASPAVANGVVYVESTDGNLYAFSTASRSRPVAARHFNRTVPRDRQWPMEGCISVPKIKTCTCSICRGIEDDVHERPLKNLALRRFGSGHDFIGRGKTQQGIILKGRSFSSAIKILCFCHPEPL